MNVLNKANIYGDFHTKDSGFLFNAFIVYSASIMGMLNYSPLYACIGKAIQLARVWRFNNAVWRDPNRGCVMQTRAKCIEYSYDRTNCTNAIFADQFNNDVITSIKGVLSHAAVKMRHYFILYNTINFIINDHQ